MGACCSCHRGGRFDSYLVEQERDHHTGGGGGGGEREENGDIVLRGDAGARIRLTGSSKYISMFSQQGRKGVNQDAMTVWENFSGDKDMFFCGVFDGHGPSGHKVARYMRDFLPAKISYLYKQPIVVDIEADEPEDGSGNAPEYSRNPLFLSWKARLTKCFHEMDDQLEGEASIESYCSGTTSVCVLKKAEHLIIANLGDSRAVLCTRDENDHLVSEQLTVDLKPNLPGEAHRIRSCEGRVLAMDEEPNVYRIWMPNEDCPGLAMARAFGDFCLKDFGLISTPQVTYRKLTQKDEFVVLATDGIWDALSNDEVVKVVASAGSRSVAAKMVVERAVRTWRYKYPRAKIDDCAVVCLFFKRQRPALTKSVSEVTQLSLNYNGIDARSCTESMKSDDALDTVLNCDVKEGGDQSNNTNTNNNTEGNRTRKRRPPVKKIEHVGE
ncbi:hypothetical protein ABFS83_10G009100 [Erythranthe nasuta]